jgi:hypothetical protein
MGRGDLHEEILVECIKVCLKLSWGHTCSCWCMCWVIVYVGEKDCLGVLGFDMFSIRQLYPLLCMGEVDIP